MKKIIFIVIGCALFALLLEAVYFGQAKTSPALTQVDETFIEGGSLGRILKEQRLIQVADESHDLAINGACARKDEVKGFDFHEQFRLRVNIEVSDKAKFTLGVAVGPRDEQTRFFKDFRITPEDKYVSLVFKATKGDEIYLKYEVSSGVTAQLHEVVVEGRFHRSQQLVYKGEATSGEFTSVNLIAGNKEKTLHGNSPEASQYLKTGFDAKMYKGTFPGKKNVGHCKYSALPLNQTLIASNNEQDRLLPHIKIKTEEGSLYGELGIIDQKKNKGKRWERPAELIIESQNRVWQQAVGLRFHGGTPGRTKKIDSFRVYARKSLGVDTIPAEAIFGLETDVDIVSLVLKYTFQAFREGNVDFNPFIHVLALNMAAELGAIVPRHHLVDLTINDEQRGLYLAMEHLSRRTFKYWLKHDDFTLYTYKSKNSQRISVSLFKVAYAILKLRGDETFEKLSQHFSIDNVINSILTTAYIGDDDYCQGVELLEKRNDVLKITSVNWDLDHAFVTSKDGVNKIDPNKYGFRLIQPGKTKCVRQWMFAWTYLQSPKFRQEFQQAFENISQTKFNPQNSVKLLDQYKALNQEFFKGKYTQQIAELEEFLAHRSKNLAKQLERLNQKIANIDAATVVW